MKTLILLHSSSGNTRLVTRYARRRLEALGLEVTLHDIVRRRGEPLDLEGVELLGVAFPVMYFWPTLAMVDALERLPDGAGAIPSFVLATAAGDPGAALHIACEQLQNRGYPPLAAHWVIAPSNWPTHVAAARLLRRLPGGRPLYRASLAALRPLLQRMPWLRPLAGLVWLEASEPGSFDRSWLDRWLEQEVWRRAQAVRAGGELTPPPLEQETLRPMVRAGRAFPPLKAAQSVKFTSMPEQCTACGICAAVCPASCISYDSAGRPIFGPGCTGCFACYNACVHGAIRSNYCPPALGRYEGPPATMRLLFQPATR